MHRTHWTGCRTPWTGFKVKDNLKPKFNIPVPVFIDDFNIFMSIKMGECESFDNTLI